MSGAKHFRNQNKESACQILLEAPERDLIVFISKILTATALNLSRGREALIKTPCDLAKVIIEAR